MLRNNHVTSRNSKLTVSFFLTVSCVLICSYLPKAIFKCTATKNSLNFEKYLVFEASFDLMLPYFP